jgi:hypothetical protein
MCPQYEEENLSEQFSAEIVFCKIDPWPIGYPGFMGGWAS